MPLRVQQSTGSRIKSGINSITFTMKGEYAKSTRCRIQRIDRNKCVVTLVESEGGITKSRQRFKARKNIALEALPSVTREERRLFPQQLWIVREEGRLFPQQL